jgi:hypothetical protein
MLRRFVSIADEASVCTSFAITNHTYRLSDLLPSWPDVEDRADWTGLLLGNGASIAIWPQFRYSSLFEVASNDVSHPLSNEDERLFEALDTENFEQVLASLKTAGIVGAALDLGVDELLEARYRSIQRALFDAVHATHVTWDLVARNTVPALFDALTEYQYVFSTNYDLLVYWASMHKGGHRFKDFFWASGTTFDASDTAIWESQEDWTRILFLHGGIHLRRLRGGGTRKVVASDGAILDQFATDYSDDESPLLVSEGESSDKLASITSSDYLSFAYQQFAEHEGGLVVFGQSLGDGDDHLIRPLKSWRKVPIAISMLPSDDEERLVQEQDRYRSRVSPRQSITFFDATTHPLGNADLRAQTPTVFGRDLIARARTRVQARRLGVEHERSD